MYSSVKVNIGITKWSLIFTNNEKNLKASRPSKLLAQDGGEKTVQ